jgi:hypothetical protein
MLAVCTVSLINVVITIWQYVMYFAVTCDECWMVPIGMSVLLLILNNYRRCCFADHDIGGRG